MTVGIECSSRKFDDKDHGAKTATYRRNVFKILIYSQRTKKSLRLP